MGNRASLFDRFHIQAAHLKELRESYPGEKLTQEKIADRLGITAKTYGTWERGQARPDTPNLEMLADLFNVSTDYILGRSEDKQNGDSAIAEATGLTVESVRTLRYLSHAKEKELVFSETPLHNQANIDFLNRVLSPLAKYAINDGEYVRLIQTPLYDMEMYVLSGDVTVYTGGEESEIVSFHGKANMVPHGMSATRLYREALLSQIKTYLDNLVEECCKEK